MLETIASPEAIISAPGIRGPHWQGADGQRLYDEREYIIDGRRPQRVTVARRYPENSLEERKIATASLRQHVEPAKADG